MRKIFRKLLQFISLCSSGLLMLSSVATVLPPQILSYFSLLGLVAPLFFFISLVLAIYYFFRKRKFYGFFSLLSVLIYFPIFLNFFSLNFFKSNEYAKQFDVLSYNVRQFDHYNWIEKPGTTSELFHLLRTYGSDIMCLQEFYHSPNRNLNSIDSILASGKWSDYAYSPYFINNKNVNSGLVIFSRFEMINNAIVSFPNSLNKAIYADLVVYSDTLRVYNVHLESIHFAGLDYDIMNGRISKNENILIRLKSIFSKLKFAFIQRSRQIEIIKQQIRESPYSIILAGDFNDTPNSYAYSSLKNYLKDSFLESGFGLGKTYVGFWPWLRIDYLFHSDDIENLDFKKSNKRLSDHFAIRGVYRFSDGD